MSAYWENFEDAPDDINPFADGVQEAIRDFERAASMLTSADGPHAGDSFEQFDRIYAAAKRQYNENLVKLYRDTGIKPPTL